jgi:uncharacterized protein YuzE
VKINYDGRGDTLSILIAKRRIVRAEEHGPIIANFDGKNKLVELEILSASQVFGEFVTALMKAKPGAKMIEVAARI